MEVIRASGRSPGQHSAEVSQVGLKCLGLHVRTQETQTGLQRATSQLRVGAVPAVSSLFPSASPPLSPRMSPPRCARAFAPRSPGPTSRAAAPRAPRCSSGTPGRAGAAGGWGRGRHGPQPPALGWAGPPRSRPAARPPLRASAGCWAGAAAPHRRPAWPAR